MFASLPRKKHFDSVLLRPHRIGLTNCMLRTIRMIQTFRADGSSYLKRMVFEYVHQQILLLQIR